MRALKRGGLAAFCGATVGKGYCGLVGAPNRCEYAVMGPTVNLAARLMCAAEASAGEAAVFVDEGIRKSARESQNRRHVFAEADPVKAKGFPRPVKVFALGERTHHFEQSLAFLTSDECTVAAVEEMMRELTRGSFLELLVHGNADAAIADFGTFVDQALADPEMGAAIAKRSKTVADPAPYLMCHSMGCGIAAAYMLHHPTCSAPFARVVMTTSW